MPEQLERHRTDAGWLELYARRSVLHPLTRRWRGRTRAHNGHILWISSQGQGYADRRDLIQSILRSRDIMTEALEALERIPEQTKETGRRLD